MESLRAVLCRAVEGLWGVTADLRPKTQASDPLLLLAGLCRAHCRRLSLALAHIPSHPFTAQRQPAHL